MKTTKLFRFTLLMVLLAGILTACNDEDELRLSPIQETTMEGSASTLQIEMTRGDWSIASITTLYGTTMVDSDNRPLQLEGTGSLHFRWFDLTREDETLITIRAKDNFDEEERGFIINLETKTGFYKEQVIVRQAVCTNFYQVKSIAYSIGEGDGMEEAEGREWRINVYDYTNQEGGSWTTRFWPFYNEYVIYSFEHSGNESPYKYTGIGNDIYVDIPKGIEEDGSISYEAEKMPYGMWKTYDSELKETAFSVEQMYRKLNTYSADIYYKQLQLSFVLTLYRPGSDAELTFSGKLVKQYPYGCSEIRHEVSDLPPEGNE